MVDVSDKLVSPSDRETCVGTRAGVRGVQPWLHHCQRLNLLVLSSPPNPSCNLVEVLTRSVLRFFPALVLLRKF